MTLNQKVKVLQQQLKQAREKSHHLGIGERKLYKAEIHRYKEKISDMEDDSLLVGYLKKKLTYAGADYYKLKQDKDRLERKLDYVTKLYEKELNETPLNKPQQ